MSGIGGLLVPLVVGLLGGSGPSFFTYLRSKRTDATKARIAEGGLELDERRADGEAYERAQQINQQIVASLSEQVTRLESTIESLNRELEAERHRNAELAGHIRELMDSAATMRRLLKDAGVEYPPKTEGA